MSVLLDKAVEAYRWQCIFQQANAAYAALRSDPKAWAEELTERQEWEGTLGDDLAEAKASPRPSRPAATSGWWISTLCGATSRRERDRA